MVGELQHFHELLGWTTSTSGKDTGQIDPLLDELPRVFGRLELPRIASKSTGIFTGVSIRRADLRGSVRNVLRAILAKAVRIFEPRRTFAHGIGDYRSGSTKYYRCGVAQQTYF